MEKSLFTLFHRRYGTTVFQSLHEYLVKEIGSSRQAPTENDLSIGLPLGVTPELLFSSNPMCAECLLLSSPRGSSLISAEHGYCLKHWIQHRPFGVARRCARETFQQCVQSAQGLQKSSPL